MAVVGFTQDPEAQPGAGFFHGDDGAKVYAYHPDLASQLPPVGQPQQAPVQPSPELMQAAQGGPDLRLAANDQPNQSSAADVSTSTATPNQSAAPPTGPLASEGPAPRVGVTEVEHPGPSPEAIATAQQDKTLDRLIQPRTGGAHPAGFTPKSREESRTLTGAPYTDQDYVDDKRRASAVLMAQLGTADVQAKRAEAEARQADLQNVELLKQQAAQRADMENRRKIYEGDVANVRTLIEKTNDQSIDPNRWFHKAGTFGSIAAALGQAIGAKAAVLGKTENFAGKIIDQAIANDIASQRAEIEQGGARANNALKMLSLSDGDLDKASTKLAMIQQGIAANTAQKIGALYKRDDIMAHANEIAAKADQDFENGVRVLRDKAMGTVTQKGESVYHPASNGQPTMDAERLNKMMTALTDPKGIGMSREQARDYLARNYGIKSGAANQGDNVDAANVVKIGDKHFSFESPKAADAAREKGDATAQFLKEGEELVALLDKGVLSPAERARASTIQRAMSLHFGPTFSGSTRINEQEINMGKAVMGDPDAFKTDVLGRTRASIGMVLDHAKAELEHLTNQGHPVEESMGRDSEGRARYLHTYIPPDATPR